MKLTDEGLIRFTVYALIDPTTGHTRYVGVSRKGARKRAVEHCGEARMYDEFVTGDDSPFGGPGVHLWLLGLWRQRLAPVVKVLATCSVRNPSRPTPAIASFMEQSWIVHLAKSCPLLNGGLDREGWQKRKVTRLIQRGLPIPRALRPYRHWSIR